MQWYYGLDGQQQGPVSTDELKQLVDSGRLPADALAWREGMAEWQPIAQLGELTSRPLARPPRLPPPARAASPSPAPAAPALSPEAARHRRPWPLSLLAILWFLAGSLMGVGGLLGLLAVPEGPDALSAKLVLVLVAMLGALQVLAALGVWMLRAWGRLLGLGLGALSLLAIPFGTVIGAVLIAYLVSPGLRLLFGPKRVDEMSAQESADLVAVHGSGLGTTLGVLLLLCCASPLMIGPLAAIAVPNFLNAVQRGKQKRTMADMQVVATALEQYAIDQQAYPSVEGEATALEAVLVPTYLERLPTSDGWGNALAYEAHEDAGGYWLVSYGSDGLSSGPEEGPTTRFSDDILMATGVFVTHPQGSQS